MMCKNYFLNLFQKYVEKMDLIIFDYHIQQIKKKANYYKLTVIYNITLIVHSYAVLTNIICKLPIYSDIKHVI